MRLRFIMALGAGLMLAGLESAKAAMFGNDKTIHQIEDVKVTGPAGEAIFGAALHLLETATR